MKSILILGAGRSSGSLIKYLSSQSQANNFIIKVGDRSHELALEKTKGLINTEAFSFDIEDSIQRETEIKNATIVVSLLPPALHILAAKDCLAFNKNLVTASYISPEINAYHDEAIAKGILLLNECGLDPGIDHMSAMEIIHRLKNQGAKITSFKSYTGGLVAPESNDNPWGYKFTWNPRNVILAGQGTAKYISNGKYHYLPYSHLFNETTSIDVGANGKYDGYANRDSLSYRKHYGIDTIPTLIRGTLRQEGYCAAWNVFVKLGLTDDTFIVEDSMHLTYAELVDAFIPESIKGTNVEQRLCNFMDIPIDGVIINKIKYTGILNNDVIGIPNASPAVILQKLLESKWVLKEHDKDMIVMQHQFEYILNGVEKKLHSSLVVKGEDTLNTAMAKTVGLPLGIATKLVLQEKIKMTGVHMPTSKEIYEPILDELKSMGISFDEKYID
jgi:saccharopine dehydrogenase-like NADP-dependent oxidoreductase